MSIQPSLEELQDDMKRKIVSYLTPSDLIAFSLTCKSNNNSCEDILSTYKTQSDELDKILSDVFLLHRNSDKTLYMFIPKLPKLTKEENFYVYNISNMDSRLYVRPDERTHFIENSKLNYTQLNIMTQFKHVLMLKIYDQIVTQLQTNPEAVNSEDGTIFNNLHGTKKYLNDFKNTLESYLFKTDGKHPLVKDGGRNIKTELDLYKPSDRRVILPGKTRKSIVYVKRGHDYVKKDSKFVSLKKVMSIASRVG